MKFKAAIFDLDGKLLNSMDVWKQIDISFLQKRGLPVPADYVTGICSRSFAETYLSFLKKWKIWSRSGKRWLCTSTHTM